MADETETDEAKKTGKATGPRKTEEEKRAMLATVAELNNQDAAAKLGTSAVTLGKWRKEYGKDGQASSSKASKPAKATKATKASKATGNDDIAKLEKELIAVATKLGKAIVKQQLDM